MSLQAPLLSAIPEQTAQIARAGKTLSLAKYVVGCFVVANILAEDDALFLFRLRLPFKIREEERGDLDDQQYKKRGKPDVKE